MAKGWALLLLLLLTACSAGNGGAEHDTGTQVAVAEGSGPERAEGNGHEASQPVDSPEAIADRFLNAVWSGDAEEAWALLASPSREKWPSAEEFRRNRFAALEREWSDWERYRVEREAIFDEAALVILHGEGGTAGPHAEAAALTLVSDEGSWRVLLDGPIRVVPLSPASGALVDPVDVAISARVEASSAIRQLKLFLDDHELQPEFGGASETAPSAFAFVKGPLLPGDHIVTLYAVDADGHAQGYAWLFQAAGK